MKKIKWLFAAVIVITLFAGLFYRSILKNKGFEKTEFMFDTQCTVTAYGKDAKAAVNAAFDRMAEIHNITNFFSKESQVFMINKAEAGEEIPVCDDICNMLSAAMEVSELSGGAFDISIAPVVSLWEFSGEGRVPEPDEISRELKKTGNDKIVFDKEKKTVTKTVSSAKIDLGGVAKGYAGDIAMEVLESFDISGAVVDLGGNITVMGENPKTKGGEWRIGMQKPYSPTGEFDEVLTVKSGAVVTSGSYQRYFEKDGKKYHHIIDPKTGYPADEDYSSVTVVTEKGLYGDCLATACFVLGEEQGRQLAEKFGAEIYFR